jgi:hypothetical protein
MTQASVKRGMMMQGWFFFFARTSLGLQQELLLPQDLDGDAQAWLMQSHVIGFHAKPGFCDMLFL